MHSISKNLKQIRQQHGWTQQQMADVLFVTRQTISNWENGKSMPDLDMLTSIAEKLEVDVNVLLYGPQPVNDSGAKDIRKSLLILAICIFLELNKSYISMLCGRTYSMFDIMMSNFITMPLICFTGAMLALQLCKAKGLVTGIPQVNQGKAVQKIMLAIYLVPLIILRPYIISQFAWFFYTWVGELLGYSFSSNSKIIMPGLKAFGYMMQQFTAFLYKTPFGNLLWTIAISVTENNIIFNIILVFAGFIYELEKPFGGRVKLTSIFNFDKTINIFNNLQNMVENFKSNFPAVKKRFTILAVIFIFCLFASCIIGENNDGYVISQVNKSLLMPMIYVSAGLIMALAANTVRLANTGSYQKTNRIFTALTIIAVGVSIAVYLPYLIKDIIVIADHAGMSFGISPMLYLQKVMNFPDWYKYIYSLVENLATGGLKNKLIVYTLPAFIAGITKADK